MLWPVPAILAGRAHRIRSHDLDNPQSFMEGVGVAGTPEQLMLLTLARKIDDMDERFGDRFAKLSDRVAELGKRLSIPTAKPAIADYKPPREETAEEEAERVVKALDEYPLTGLHSDGRRMRMISMAHKVNRDHLRRNGFRVNHNNWSQTLIEWQAVGCVAEALDPNYTECS